MMRKFAAALWAALAGLCAGCDGTIFKTFDLRSGQSLSIDARQRLVLVGNRDTGQRRTDGTPVQQQIICTEPSPDAIVAKAAAVAASATTPQIAAALGASMSESAASIGVRTPTIQLLRDGLFRACEAYMNGLLTKPDYHAIMFNYDRIMTALLLIDAAAGFKLPPNVAINAGQVAVDTSAKRTPVAPGADAPPGAAPATTEATGRTTSQPATAPAFAPAGAGYDGAAVAAKDVLLKVASSMLDDPTRVAFCVTPDQSDTVGPGLVRNEYFHSICRSMSSVVAAYADGVRLQNQMKQQCLRNPQLAVCARLNW